MSLDCARALIAGTPDFPSPGIVFRDIGPLLADASALSEVTDALAAPFDFDLVAGIEARGFLLAGAVAVRTSAGLLPVRKAGKLPRPDASASYTLEYGEASIEASGDLRGRRVLIVDDVLATGGTLAAACEVIASLGGTIAGTAVLIDLGGFDDRPALPQLHALFRM